MVSKMPSTVGRAGIDRDFLSEPRGAFEPALSDLGKAAAVVPDAAELDPGIRQRVE